MSAGFRPQVRWAVLGPLLGALSGSLAAFVLLVGGVVGGTSSATDVLASLGPLAVLAVAVGGTIGAAVGLVCGVPLVLLVGRHLPRRVARRRAALLGALLPPAALAVLLGVVSDGSTPGASALAWYAAPALLGSVLAARAESRLMPHDDVS